MKIYIRVCLILIVLLLLFGTLFSSFASETNTAPSEQKTPHSYRNIPLLSDGQIQAVDTLKTKHEAFTILASQSEDSFDSIDGKPSFLQLLASLLTEFFDIPFQVKYFDTRREALAHMSEGDFYFGEIAETSPLANTGKAIVPIDHPVYLYAAQNGAPLEFFINTQQTPRLAFIEDSIVWDKIKNVFPTSFEVVWVERYSDVIELLESNAIDYFMSDGTLDIYFNKYPNIVRKDFFPFVYTQNSLYIQDSELLPFISAIEAYFQGEGFQRVQELHQTGLINFDEYWFFLLLTAEEKAYIQNHLAQADPIPFGASYDNYPVCYFDKSSAAYQGISIDVLQKITELTGLRFAPHNTSQTPWHTILDDLTNQRIPLVSELIKTPARIDSGLFLWPDTHYTEDQYALLSLINAPDITPEEISQHQVGLLRSMGYSEMFKTWFPSQEPYPEYAIYTEAYNALANGEIEYLMGTKNLLLNYSNLSGLYGLKAPIIFDYSYQSSFGFHQNEAILCSIFSKAQPFINMTDISARWKLKTYDYSPEIRKSIQRMSIIIAAAVILVILCFSVMRIRKDSRAKQNLETLVHLRTLELEEQTQSVQMASQAKSNFLGRMSHELRTPMNAILSMSTLAQQSMEADSKTHRTIANVISAATQLLGLLNDILDMSNIESSHLSLSKKPFSLEEMLQEVCDGIEKQCLEKKIIFARQLDALPPLQLIGDKLRLKQVLNNLLGNSVKFTPNGGKIQIWMDFAEKNGEISLSFRIKDNGIGIAPEQLKTLFTPYEQSGQRGGTGLGLSISQQLVNLMGGEITVNSKENKGTTFYFTVHMTAGEAIAPVEMITQASDLNLEPYRILIVDDIEMNRLILLELLADTHAKLEEAFDGVDAYQKFMTSPVHYYDLILMDIKMPNMDGYESTRSIRSLNRPDAQVIPIISVSANNYYEDIEKSLAAGMNCHLAKPINIPQLLQTIHGFLS